MTGDLDILELEEGAASTSTCFSSFVGGLTGGSGFCFVGEVSEGGVEDLLTGDDTVLLPPADFWGGAGSCLLGTGPDTGLLPLPLPTPPAAFASFPADPNGVLALPRAGLLLGNEGLAPGSAGLAAGTVGFVPGLTTGLLGSLDLGVCLVGLVLLERSDVERDLTTLLCSGERW